jgi:restriction system protein
MTPVTCGSCGTALDEEHTLKPDEREPCPICGSTTRNEVLSRGGTGAKGSAGEIAQMTGSTMVGVKAGASAAPIVHMASAAMVGVGAIASAGEIARNVQSITAISDLLLQSVIVPGDKTAEGRLIEAVAIPWFDIIDLLRNDPNIAFQIPADKWEEIIAGAYHKSGFEEVTLTPRSGDYGRDVIAIKRGLGSIRVVDQVKAYKPGHLVTADDVRALVGVVHGDGASKGFLTTTSDFAPLLRKDPLIVPFIPSRLELIDGKTLLARLEELARKTKG